MLHFLVHVTIVLVLRGTATGITGNRREVAVAYSQLGSASPGYGPHVPGIAGQVVRYFHFYYKLRVINCFLSPEACCVVTILIRWLIENELMLVPMTRRGERIDRRVLEAGDEVRCWNTWNKSMARNGKWLFDGQIGLFKSKSAIMLPLRFRIA